jgi:enoyl-[acyl-carrier protein] reductase II
VEGELEMGQVSALVKEIKPAADILKEMWNDFQNALQNPLK